MIKRLPIIRHIRYYYCRWRYNIWWNNYGSQLGAFPNEHDLQFLENIWYGKN